MIVQNAATRVAQLLIQLVLPPERIGVNRETDRISGANGIQQIQRLTKTGDDGSEATHHWVQRLKSQLHVVRPSQFNRLRQHGRQICSGLINSPFKTG